MPLKIRLKPREKFVINGAVMSAGDDGAMLVLHNRASLLRAADIMQPEDADTPAKRIYFEIMSLYLASDDKNGIYERFLGYWSDLMNVTSLAEVRQSLIFIQKDVSAGEYYRALKTCRAIMALEHELLHPASAQAAAEGTGNPAG